jgi:N-acetylglutamate synthase-like GNAT family acetyltransferase
MIRDATPCDYPHIQALLATHQMVPALFVPASRWWVATMDDGTICGAIGVEYGAQVWLLRSAIVTPRGSWYRARGSIDHCPHYGGASPETNRNLLF